LLHYLSAILAGLTRIGPFLMGFFEIEFKWRNWPQWIQIFAQTAKGWDPRLHWSLLFPRHFRIIRTSMSAHRCAPSTRRPRWRHAWRRWNGFPIDRFWSAGHLRFGFKNVGTSLSFQVRSLCRRCPVAASSVVQTGLLRRLGTRSACQVTSSPIHCAATRCCCVCRVGCHHSRRLPTSGSSGNGRRHDPIGASLLDSISRSACARGEDCVCCIRPPKGRRVVEHESTRHHCAGCRWCACAGVRSMSPLG